MGPGRWSGLGPVLALWMLISGCGPSVPEEAEARAAYASRRATLDALDRDLREKLGAIPHLGVDPDDLPCTPTADPSPDAVPGLGALVAGAHCTAQRIDMLEARNEATRRFEAETLPSLVERHGLRGLDVTYTMPGEPLRHSLGRTGSIHSSQREGTVSADQGPTLDGRRLGWSLYPAPKGDGAEGPGIEVVWSFPQEDAELRAVAVMLTE